MPPAGRPSSRLLTRRGAEEVRGWRLFPGVRRFGPSERYAPNPPSTFGTVPVTRRLATCQALSLEKLKQLRVDLVLVGRAHAVRRAGVDLQRRALDEFRGEHGRGADRH